jgi:hypothetical protein
MGLVRFLAAHESTLQWYFGAYFIPKGAAGFPFADGHFEIHKWLFASTKLRMTANGSFIGSPYPLAASGDNEWLQRHSSEKR